MDKVSLVTRAAAFGCPFAPGATGNGATEDLGHLFDRMGVHTGLSPSGLAETVGWLEERLARTLPGALSRVSTFPGAARV